MKSKLIDHWRSTATVTDERILSAFEKIKRENFILEDYLDEAYGDYPLPIHKGQTISQPTTIMLMTQALEPKPGQKILEIGAGSGYQAALLASVVGEKGKVITTEIIPELAEFAKQNIEKAKKAGITNVEVIHADGSNGYAKEAPYDRIMITAACPKFPEHLLEQLKIDGIIVAPVASMFDQVMIKAIKHKNIVEKKNLGFFRFVPLKGEYGY